MGEQQREPSIEELLNVIALLRKALEFYGEGRNYRVNPNSRENNSNSIIYIDMGHQARFALEQSENTMNYEQKLIDDLGKTFDMDDNEDSFDVYAKRLEEIKKRYDDI